MATNIIIAKLADIKRADCPEMRPKKAPGFLRCVMERTPFNRG